MRRLGFLFSVWHDYSPQLLRRLSTLFSASQFAMLSTIVGAPPAAGFRDPWQTGFNPGGGGGGGMMLTTNVTTITEVTTMFMIIAMFMMMMVLPPAQRLRRSSRFLSLTLLAQALTCVCHWSESRLAHNRSRQFFCTTCGSNVRTEPVAYNEFDPD